MSSANLRRKLSEVVVLRSPALTAYAAGPIADPCIMLAFMFLNSDVWSQNIHVHCAMIASVQYRSLQASYGYGLVGRAGLACLTKLNAGQYQMPWKNPKI